jgi:hypothetical protein
MKVTRAELQSQAFKLQQLELVNQRMIAHEKQAVKKAAERVTETRVARNIRLDLDKGRNLDIDV